MADFIERVKLLIETSTEGATTGLSKMKTDVANAEGAFGKLKAGAKGSFDAIKSGGPLAVAGVGAAIGAFATKAVGDFEQLAEASKNFATAAGTSVEEASRWIEVSNDLGVNTEAVQGAMARLNREAEAGKLAQFGITAEDANGRLIQTLQYLASIPDEARRSAASFELLGKGGAAIAPLLANVSSLQDRLSGVTGGKLINDADVAEARKLADSLDNLKDAAESIALSLAKGLAPTIDKIAELIGKVNKVSGGDSGHGGLIDWLAKAAFWTPGIDALNAGLDAVGGSTDDVSKATDAASRTLFTATSRVESHTKATDNDKDAQDKLQKSYEDLAQALLNLNTAHDAAKRSSDALNSTFQAGLEDNFATHDAYAKIEDGVAGVVDVLKQAGPEFRATGDHVTTFTKTGRDLLGSLHTLGTAIGEDLGQTLKESGGNYDDVRKKADDYREQLIAEATAAGASADSVQGYIEMLNLTPEQVETTIRLSKEEDARQKLLAIQGAISGLPKDVQLAVIAQASAGDYIGAMQTVQDYATAHPAESSLDLKTELSQSAYDNWKSNVQAPGNAPIVSLGVSTTEAGATIQRFMRENADQTITIRTVIINPDGTTSVSSNRIRMAGGPINESGVYDVGEAGRERVFLPRGANVMSAGQLMTAEAGGGGAGVINNYWTVNVPPTLNPAEVGGKIVSAITAYERRSGMGWRNGGRAA